MTPNMGTMDRAVRLAAALIINILYFTGFITGDFGMVMGIVAVALVVTSFVSWCPLYGALRLSTRAGEKK